jgi:hypothetical protein
MRRTLMTIVFGAALALSAGAAEVVVRVAPPAAIVERRPVAPGPGYVWIGGYHRWDGAAYGWVPGRWEMPPRRRARWIEHHWVHRHGGWVLVEGRWR